MDLLVGSGKDYGDDARKIVLANCEAIGDEILKIRLMSCLKKYPKNFHRTNNPTIGAPI